MKKMFLSIATLLVLCLTGCSHEHTWKEATCTEPKTCSECGEKEGEPLGHNWGAATCTEQSTCSRCGLKDGDVAGHKWVEATCTEPKKCSVCGETEGTALGHSVDIGICPRCKEVVNEDILIQFSSDVNTFSIEDMSIESFDTSSVSGAYRSAVRELSNIQQCNNKINKLINKYSSYKSLKNVIDAMRNIVQKTPSEPSNNLESIQNYLSEHLDYMNAYQNYISVLQSFIKSNLD